MLLKYCYFVSLHCYVQLVEYISGYNIVEIIYEKLYVVINTSTKVIANLYMWVFLVL